MKPFIEMALAAGFTATAPLDPAKLEALPAVRDMCAANRCKAYGKNWTCPPVCGTLEECAARMRGFSRGLLVQSVGELENEFDYEGMMALEEVHKKRFSALAKQLQERLPKVLCLGAGGCRVCKECAWPAPCRFPHKAHASMEAYGLLVSRVCEACDVPYYYGSGKLAYTSCYLF